MVNRAALKQVLEDPEIDNETKREVIRKISGREPSGYFDDYVPMQTKLFGVNEERYGVEREEEHTDASSLSSPEEIASNVVAQIKGPSFEKEVTTKKKVLPKSLPKELIPEGTSKEYIKSLEDLKATQERGIEDYSDAEKTYRDQEIKSNEELQQFYGEQAKQKEAQAEQGTKIKQVLLDQYMKKEADWQSSQVVPLRLLANSSTGAKLGLAIAQGIASGLGDQRAMDRIQGTVDSMIEMDIAAQEGEVEKKGLGARNMLSMIKVALPEYPEETKDKARELYNKFMLLKAESMKKMARTPEQQAKLQSLTEGLAATVANIQKARSDSAEKIYDNKIKAMEMLSTETTTSSKTGTGQAGRPATAAVVDSMAGSVNFVDGIDDFIKKYEKSGEGSVSLPAISVGTYSTDASASLADIQMSYGRSQYGANISKSEAERVEAASRGGLLTGKKATYGSLSNLMGKVINKINEHKANGYSTPNSERALIRAKILYKELRRRAGFSGEK